MEVLMVQWLSLLEMDTAAQVQILDEAVCIFHSADTFAKGMDSTIMTPTVSK